MVRVLATDDFILAITIILVKNCIINTFDPTSIVIYIYIYIYI